MDMEEKQVLAPPLAKSQVDDEVDFHSGYETQYQKEYSPLKHIYVPPPDKENAWYRSWNTIMMIIFLAAVFLLGTILLIIEVFTASPIKVLLIVAGYVCGAGFIIWVEVKSIKVR